MILPMLLLAITFSTNASQLLIAQANQKSQKIIDSRNQVRKIKLNLPGNGIGRDAYFVDLLKTALIEVGYLPIITFEGELNYKREMKYLHEGRISLTWRLKSEERDQAYYRIDMGLTQNMIGQRVFLIPNGQQHKFNNINSIEDLINSGLIGVFNENWFDIKIWQKNNIPYTTIIGNIDKIYTMLASGKRGMDYFSRSIIEVYFEVNRYKALEIEQNLLFVYPQDFYFYFSRLNIEDKKHIESALLKAKQNGLTERLIKKHWGDLANKLNIYKRTVIPLTFP
jgi:hypothetical protein